MDALSKSDRPTGGAAVGGAAAQIYGWLGVGLVNAVVIALTAPPARSGAAALWHHAFDAGHAAFLGLLSAGAVHAWQRRRRGVRAALLAQWAAAFSLGGFILAEDLTPAASRWGAGIGSWAVGLVLVGLVAAGSAAVPCCALSSLAARQRRWLRIVLAAVGVEAAAANHFVLERNYPGVHLYIAWLAALLMAGAIAGTRLAWPPLQRIERSGVRTPLLGALGLLAAFSVLWPAPRAVLVRALSRSGSALAPFVSRAHALVRARRMTAEPELSRSEQPPTSPPLLSHPPLIVLLTIDGLRADVLGDESLRERLPRLAALRERAAELTEARTVAPATHVALTSIFAGRYFSELSWTGGYRDGWEAFAHHDATPRLPELLRAAGVTTVVIHGYDWMGADSGVTGRFDEELYVAPVPVPGAQHFARAEQLADAAIERLARAREGPLFLYMHWLDTHAPYNLGGAHGSDYEDYLAEVALVDRALDRLWTALEAPAIAERSLLIVSADHGEAFGDHDTRYHGLTIYDEILRVPLLFAAHEIAARRIDTPVSLMDLGPTVLDLFGAATPAAHMGQSLVPLLAGKPFPADRIIIADSGRHMRAAVFPDGMKLIHDRRRGTVELYDLLHDPGEKDNLVDLLAGEADARLDVLERFFAGREAADLPYRVP